MTTVVAPETLPAIQHAGKPVVLTTFLAALYGTDENNIAQNFKRNQARFVAGKHFYKLEGEELRYFKHCMTKSHSVEIPRQTRNLILWTERGAARHAKMLDTDQAWEVFERLEDCYFNTQAETLALPSGLSPAHQRHIQKRVSELAHQPGNSFASVYRSIKDHFQVGTYKDIAESQYPALCRFLQCDPLTGDILEPDKPEGLWLSYCEVQSLYLLMSNAAIVRKLAEEASLYPISKALQSKPLSDLASQITYGGPSFNTLDKRRDEIYAIYSRNGCEGGYAWRPEA